MTTVDELAQIIRQVDGNHSLGAGALAEAIIAKLPHIAARQPVGEPVGFVLYEQQDKLVLFQGSWETDERWFWPEREQAQAAADRLHESHSFPKNYWRVTPVSAAPPAQAADTQPVGEPVVKSVGIDALAKLLEDEAAECEKAWVERADTYMSGRASGFLLAADHFRKIATSQRWSEFLSSPAQAVDLGPSIPSELAPVAAALKRFNECAEDCDSDGCDIGRDWFDALTTMGLLKRTQRSPAVWAMTAEGDRLLALIDGQAVGNK